VAASKGRLCALVVSLLLAAMPAAADWPERAVKVIVPFPPGGANDTIARPYADALSQSFGQPFVVENKGGAGGAIGAEATIKAKPDGYTFCMCSSTVFTTVANLRKTPYTAEDAEAAAMATMYISGLALSPAIGVRSFEEFLAHARANPGKINYGSSGVGSVGQLRMAYLGKLAGLEMTHVPYAGNAPALADLLAGTIQALIELNVFPHVKAGKLTMVAMYAEQRHPDFPDVPTVAELGYPQLNTPVWQGFFAPRGTPEPILTKLNEAVAKISADPAFSDRLLKLGYATRSMSVAELRDYFRADDALHKRIIAEAGITID
jgi:tripartite-type tricarboxylate transporter receptor subunit TctC